MCHAIIALALPRWLETLSVACDCCPWNAHKYGQRPSWNSIISLKHHTMLDDVDVRMQQRPLDNKHNYTTSRMAFHHSNWIIHIMTSVVECHHLRCTAHTNEKCRAWHAIITLRQHKRSDYVGRRQDVSCPRIPWKAHTVGRSQEWHAIMAVG